MPLVPMLSSTTFPAIVCLSGALDIPCSCPPLMAILCLASLHAGGLKRCSAPPWHTSTRILLAQSLRRSVRSGSQEERTLSLSIEMKFKSHFIGPHCSSSRVKSPVYLLTAFCKPSCLLFLLRSRFLLTVQKSGADATCTFEADLVKLAINLKCKINYLFCIQCCNIL